MNNFNGVSILTSWLDYNAYLRIWGEIENGGKQRFWIEISSNPEVVYDEQGELIFRTKRNKTTEVNTFDEVLKLNENWHLGSIKDLRYEKVHPDFRDKVWEEFKERKSKSNDIERKRIEAVEYGWAEACGKIDKNGQIIE